MSQSIARTNPPDIVRTATVELIVDDLKASRAFYHDILGLLVTFEDSEAIYLRAFEEYLHHSLVLRKGPVPAAKLIGYRVRTPQDLELAEEYYRALGAKVLRCPAGTTLGMGETVRVQDAFGFPLEFFHEAEHVERFTQRYDAYKPATPLRLDHVNVLTSNVPALRDAYKDLGFRVSEEIRDDTDSALASWLYRKQTVHDIALTAGDGPRLHHFAFNVQERQELLHVCDLLGALRQSYRIERGPGRHGVSNACYLYLRDPDGHRVEIFTTHYYTGDPDNPMKVWSVHDSQRRSWWGHSVIPTWYTEASNVLDLDGNVFPTKTQEGAPEMKATAGPRADGY